ncbi:MAG: GyrI-like domain-containing protein [Filifactoraceae bacterium]
MKYEWRKQEKNLYGVKQTPIILEVPKQKFILVKGKGNPNEVDFSDRISALYSLAYTIKILFKNAMKNKTDNEITNFTVYPLEGFWKKVNGEEGEELDKNKLEYTLMIKQPDFITQEIFTKALENIKKKKPNPLYEEIRFREIEDGKSIQILHVGSYDDEPKSFEQMNEFARKLDLTRIGDFHKEIYLSNKNRTSEEKQKTILRYSVK